MSRTCQHAPCGRPITGQGKRFCSLACYGRQKRLPPVARVCPCGAAFGVRRHIIAMGKGRYCSNPCRIKYHSWRAFWESAA